MQFMYQYPETTGPDGDMLDAGDVAALAVTVERAGWHGFSFTEHPVPGARWLAAGGHQTLDPFVALGVVGAVTERLRLLTYLAVLPYRNPFLIAKAAATVDRLSNGRFILGVGAGYLKGEFQALGVDFDERNALFDEALEVLPLHWSGKPFSYQGRHFEAREMVALPRPHQDPIPIWIGGNSALTLRRVARSAQGWMPLTSHVDISSTTRTPHIETLDGLAALIAEVRTSAGPRGAELDVVVSYTDPTIATPENDVERHREHIGRLGEIGATWVVVGGPATTPPANVEFIEAFASTYIQ
jgi:probable F420-dependent oxidoreductase